MGNRKKTNKEEKKRPLTNAEALKAKVDTLEAEAEALKAEAEAHTAKALREDIAELEARKLSKFSARNMFFAVGIILIIIGITIYFIFDIKIIPIIIASIGLLYVLVGLLSSTRYTDLLIDQKKLELELIDMPGVGSIELRAEKLFKAHKIEVQKYYDLTLTHGNRIFYTGIICIILGFAIIGGTIFLVYRTTVPIQEIEVLPIPPGKEIFEPIVESMEINNEEDVGESSVTGEGGLGSKIVLAALGAVGGILTNYIAYIYLSMFSKTTESLNEFHNRLVHTHYLHFGNFLVSKIEDVNLREKTLADIASKLGLLQNLTAGETDEE